jgi:hypothetical protein
MAANGIIHAIGAPEKASPGTVYSTKLWWLSSASSSMRTPVWRSTSTALGRGTQCKGRGDRRGRIYL